MKKTFGDMVRSLGLMAVIVAVMLFIGARYLIFPGSADRMPAVDYSSVVQGFRDEAKVAPEAPVGLPSSWRANAARLLVPAPGVKQMHIGWALPHSRYAGLDEATGVAVIGNVLGNRAAATMATTDIAGAVWEQRTSDLGERAYTRQSGGLVIVVTGNASDADLRRLATSLR